MSTTFALHARALAEIEERWKQVADRRSSPASGPRSGSTTGCLRSGRPTPRDHSRQVRKWVRTYRTQGLDGLATLHYEGDPSQLRRSQMSGSRPRSRPDASTTYARSPTGSSRRSRSATPRAGSRRCCAARGQLPQGQWLSGRPTEERRRSSANIGGIAARRSDHPAIFHPCPPSRPGTGLSTRAGCWSGMLLCRCRRRRSGSTSSGLLPRRPRIPRPSPDPTRRQGEQFIDPLTLLRAPDP